MKTLKNITEIKDASEAIQLAIDWQSWMSEQNLSYDDCRRYANYFEALAHKFGLEAEFNENCIY